MQNDDNFVRKVNLMGVAYFCACLFKVPGHSQGYVQRTFHKHSYSSKIWTRISAHNTGRHSLRFDAILNAITISTKNTSKSAIMRFIFIHQRDVCLALQKNHPIWYFFVPDTAAPACVTDDAPRSDQPIPRLTPGIALVICHAIIDACYLHVCF